MLGQHTAAVLHERLGVPATGIDELADRGVITVWRDETKDEEAP